MNNKIITGDRAKVLTTFSDETVDLVVTSPPYDNIRDYKGYVFDFHSIAKQLSRVLKAGGVIMWNVNDSTIDGSESGSSFRQALYFKDECGLKLHDTMIWEKTGAAYASGDHSNRYTQIFEYVFILSKGKPKTTNLIRDKENSCAGITIGRWSEREKNGNLKDRGYRTQPVSKKGIRNNIWRIGNGHGQGQKDVLAYKHPATMPETLARDHIISWSNAGDIVLDPFSGSGTTAVSAKMLGRRYIGIDTSEEYNKIACRRLAGI